MKAKGGYVAELTSNQKWLFDKVKSTSKKRVQLTVCHAKLNPEQRKQLWLAKRKLKQSRVVINVDLHRQFRHEQIIDNLLRVKRILNIIEHGDFPGGIHDLNFRGRLLIEFKLYGATQDLQIVFGHMHDSERPKYASLDYRNIPQSITPLGLYGHHRLVLKDEVKTRATFTPFDSTMIEIDQVFIWENIEGVLTTKLNGKFWYEYVLNNKEPFSVKEGTHYIEAQILGLVQLSDIEKIYYPVSDQNDHKFFQKFQRFKLDHGIQLVHY